MITFVPNFGSCEDFGRVIKRESGANPELFPQL